MLDSRSEHTGRKWQGFTDKSIVHKRDQNVNCHASCRVTIRPVLGPEPRARRLLLRQWRPEDREPFAAMNADPRVMEFFPSTLTREESDAVADRIQETIDACGYGFWAVEIPGVTPFAGFIGLTAPRFDAHFTPCVEMGWRLALQFWNHGYATEGAQAALAFGFQDLKLSEIVAFTVPANVRSRRVMEKLRMTYDPSEDFDHPRIAEGHPLRRHVLYRIRA